MTVAELCPFHVAQKTADAVAGRRELAQSDELVLPRHRSVVTQYTDESPKELRLYYGAKEISFDEPELFSFGETLATQSRFVAADATQWGEGHAWPRVKDLLEQLIGEGVLVRADDATPDDITGTERPSPLPPAQAQAPRSWFECESIMAELTGRPLELGHLELVLPIFRVAHMSVDADGRQVGEANVFPKPMRLDVPTEWRSCTYSGTRYQPDKPINVTALKAMRTYWGPMMAILLRVREAYLNRFPQARAGMTVGHLERLSTSVLALPTYLLMRHDAPLTNGELHPALSCLFRVTDGLRMVMHQMLFIPVGEPTLSPDSPVTASQVHAYAERNFSFHSEYAVCAGPQWMVQEFMSVLIEGSAPKHGLPEQLDAEVEAALAEIEPAMDYALLGLQAYGAVFSLWPAMTRCYEQMAAIAWEWAGRTSSPQVLEFHQRMAGHLDQLKHATMLGSEAWRVDREAVYEDMYRQCGFGLSGAFPARSLRDRLASQHSEAASAAQSNLREALLHQLGDAGDGALDALTVCIMEFLLREQAILRTAGEVQSAINAHLKRPAPLRRFDGYDIDLHNQLQGNPERRLPYLLNELQEIFGVRVTLDAERIGIAYANQDIAALCCG